MANYSTLKSNVASVVRTNGQNAITGANLQSTLYGMIESLGADYQLVGIATPSVDPGSPDQNIAYLAVSGSTDVTFTNFLDSSSQAITLPANSLGILRYNGSWSLQYASLPSGSSGGNVFVYNPNIDKNRGQAYTKANARNAVPSAMRNPGLVLVYHYEAGYGDGWEIELLLNNSSATYLADASWSVIKPPTVANVYAEGKIVLGWSGTKLAYSKSGDTYTLTIPSSIYVVVNGSTIISAAGGQTLSITIDGSGTGGPFFFLCYDLVNDVFFARENTLDPMGTTTTTEYACGIFHINGSSTMPESMYTKSGF